MNEKAHFTKFKAAHRRMAQVRPIAHSIPTPPSGSVSPKKGLQEIMLSKWNRWFRWEHNLSVAGRTIDKGWVVPQPLGIALLVVILGGVGGLYWRIIDRQAENERIAATERSKTGEQIQELSKILVRLDQRLLDKQVTDEKDQHENKNRDELQDLQIKDVKDRLLVLNTRRGG